MHATLVRSARKAWRRHLDAEWKIPGPQLGCLLVLLLTITTTPTGSRHPLALDATRAAATERRVERIVDVLLAVSTHEEGGDVHNLLAHADVALLDQHTRVVNRLCEAELEHDGLETALEENLGGEREHVIELVLGLVLLSEGE